MTIWRPPLRTLARFFGAIAAWFESKAVAGKLAARIEAVEAEMALVRRDMTQMKSDMTKVKFVAGIQAVQDVTPREV